MSGINTRFITEAIIFRFYEIMWNEWNVYFDLKRVYS